MVGGGWIEVWADWESVGRSNVSMLLFSPITMQWDRGCDGDDDYHDYFSIPAQQNLNALILILATDQIDRRSKGKN